MRILQSAALVDSRGGGVSEAVTNIAEAMAARGHIVTLLGRGASKQATDVATGAPHVRGQEIGRVAARTLGAATPDVLHSHGLWNLNLATVLGYARRARVPAVISPHGMLDHWALRQGAFKKRLALATYEGRNLHRATCIHALTETERAVVHELIPGVPVAVIPNGVKLPAETPGPEPEGGGKMLLFLGRIHPKKGIRELIEGFALLSYHHDARPWRVDIAGWDDGGHRAEVEARIAALGLSDRVRLLGPVFGEDKARLIASADAFALTSYSEGLPVTVLEAWSYARPVLITPECNLCGAGNKGAAVVCATGIHGVRDGLAELFAMSPAERTAMGAAGRVLVEVRYGWAQVAEEFESLYHWMRDKGDCPTFVS